MTGEGRTSALTFDSARSNEPPEMAALLARPPLLTFSLFALLGSTFVLQWTLGTLEEDYERYLLGAVSGLSVREGEIHRLVTATFLHMDVHHLLRNIVALTFPGILLEPWLGKLRFFLLLSTSMIAASGATAWLTPFALGVGASGMVFGCIGALFVLVRRTWSSSRREWRVLRWGLLCMLPIEIAIALNVPGVGWIAHGAGLTAGIAITPLLERRGGRIDLALRVTALILATFTLYGVSRAAWDVSRLDPRDLEGSALGRLRDSEPSPGKLAVAAGHLVDDHSQSEDSLSLAVELAERGLIARPQDPRLRDQLAAIRSEAMRRLAELPTPPPSGGPRSSRAPCRGRDR